MCVGRCISYFVQNTNMPSTIIRDLALKACVQGKWPENLMYALHPIRLKLQSRHATRFYYPHILFVCMLCNIYAFTHSILTEMKRTYGRMQWKDENHKSITKPDVNKSWKEHYKWYRMQLNNECTFMIWITWVMCEVCGAFTILWKS